jgi:hypothetical protein
LPLLTEFLGVQLAELIQLLRQFFGVSLRFRAFFHISRSCSGTTQIARFAPYIQSLERSRFRGRVGKPTFGRRASNANGPAGPTYRQPDRGASE